MEPHQLYLQEYGLQKGNCRIRRITSHPFWQYKVFELSISPLSKTQKEAYWTAVSRHGGESKLGIQAIWAFHGKGRLRREFQSFPVSSQGKTLSGDEFLNIIGDLETIQAVLHLVFSAQ